MRLPAGRQVARQDQLTQALLRLDGLRAALLGAVVVLIVNGGCRHGVFGKKGIKPPTPTFLYTDKPLFLDFLHKI